MNIKCALFFLLIMVFLQLLLFPHNECISGKETVVYNALKTATQTANFSIYRSSELPQRWHYGQSPRTPPLLAVADVGYAFQDLIEWYEEWFQQKFNRTCKNMQSRTH
jgi:hypothetical protein